MLLKKKAPFKSGNSKKKSKSVNCFKNMLFEVQSTDSTLTEKETYIFCRNKLISHKKQVLAFATH